MPLPVFAFETNMVATTPAAQPPAMASNLWFEVGEQLRYNIYWGFLTVGETTVTTEWVNDENGRTLLLIRYKTRTNGVVETLYPVEDIQEALIDPETFLPVYYLKNSRQGKRKSHELTRFDHKNNVAYWQSFIKGKSKEIPINSDTRDLITMMYYIRSLEFSVGTNMEMKVMTDQKIYDLFLAVPRKEIVELDKYGRVSSYLFDPEAAFDGLFVRKGKMYVWVSTDQRKICTKITAKVPVASIRIELAEVTGPGEDFWVGREKKNAPESKPVPRSG
jgi:Protein of unknown function (DUF3108)